MNDNNLSDAKIFAASKLGLMWVELFLGFLLVAMPLCSSALDFTPDSSRLLADPAYVPERGQVYGNTIYSHASISGDVISYSPVVPNYSYATTNRQWSQLLAYGVTDDFSLKVSGTYIRSRTEYEFSNGTSATAGAHGLEDPIVGADLRILDQEDDSLNWDLTGSFAPNLIDAKQSSSTRGDGTVARGGNVTSLGTAISFKSRSLTIYLGANAAYSGTANFLDSNNVTVIVDPSWQYTLVLNTQTRLNRVLAFDLGVSEETYNTQYSTAFFNGTKIGASNSKPGGRSTFNAAFIFRITPDTFAATLKYSHDVYAKTNTYDTASGALAQTDRNKSVDVIGLSLEYAFD